MRKGILLVLAVLTVLTTGCSLTPAETATMGSASPAPASSLPQAASPTASYTAEASSSAESNDDYERLFDTSLTHHLTIYISRSEWDGISQDMLDYADIDIWMRTGNCRHADLVYEDENGTIEIEDVGLRTRGNTTRILPEDEAGYHRAHFALEFDETFDLDGAEQAARDGRTFCGLVALDLKWNLWTDRSHIHELWAYALLNAADVTAPRAALTTLDIVVDEQLIHYGVYTMIEPVDKTFLTRHYGTRADGGNLYKCLWENIPATLESGYPQNEVGVKNWQSGYRPAYDLKTNKTGAITWDLEVFIDNINSLSDEEFAAWIDRSFEVDKFLRYMAVDVLLGNADDYRTMGNNYYLYFNPGGKIELIPYDYDSCLGGGWDGGPACSYEALAEEDIYTVPNLNAAYMEQPISHPLADRILAIPEYRQRYEQYLLAFINTGLFSYEGFLATLEAMEAQYAAYTCSDTEDRGEVMTLTTEEWFFEAKIASVLSQLR